jgi:IgGFc binding protein
MSRRVYGRLATVASIVAIGSMVGYGCGSSDTGFGGSGGSAGSPNGQGGSASGTMNTGGTMSAGGTGGIATTSTGGMGGAVGGMGGNGGMGGAPCDNICSADFHQVFDCNGMLVQTCPMGQGCDAATGTCIPVCDAATNNKQSVGCEFYATDMESYQANYCFAAFIANTWDTPAHINVSYANTPLSVASFARIPSGQGQGLTYSPYNAAAGLPPGEVAILFLAGNSGGAPNCPVTAGVPGDAGLSGTGIGNSFQITTDVPVAAYQINPYGGGSVAVTGASLLLPTSVWDNNYVTVNAYQFDLAPPSMNIIAAQNNTTVTLTPVASVNGGGGIPSGPANQPLQFTLQQGQMAQISQNAELTGSIIQTDAPVGLMAGQPCMRTPVGVAYCDHGEQMIPPARSLGHEYVGVMHRPRAGEPAIWRMIGVQDGTTLTYSTNVGGPASLQKGEVVEFITGTPFVVSSQDSGHPFMLFTYMSGSQWNQLNNTGGYGDVDFVLDVPTAQYLTKYVFFTDPTYPETNLVLIRQKDTNGMFHDVSLDCSGVVTGWQAVGDYEWARVDLSTGNFQGVNGCSNGRHEIESNGLFGLTVWGWGTPLTSSFTSNVSYGYPGGMSVVSLNNLIIN